MFAEALALVVTDADSPVTQYLRSRKAMLVIAGHLNISLSWWSHEGAESQQGRGGPLLPAAIKTSLASLSLVQVPC